MKKNRRQDFMYVNKSSSSSFSGSRRRKKTGRFLIPGILILLIIAVLGFSRFLLPERTPVETDQTTGQESTTTTAITETTATNTVPTTDPEASTGLPSESTSEDPALRQERFAAVTADVEALLSAGNGRFAVYYHNLSTGETWSFQDDQPFVAASSIKLGINLILYQQIAAGNVSPDEILTYDSRPYPTGDFEAGTGTIQNLPNGSSLTLRETAGLSIRVSDNCGVNMIIRRLGGIDAVNEQLNQISSIVDYRQPVSYRNYAGQSSSGRHRTSARDLGSHAVELYRLWQESPEVFQPLIDDLSHTEFDFGIQKGIPEHITVAHKIGTNGAYSTENDVGIVFASEPFVLCVMTEMASAAQARTIQAEIASLFYSFCNFTPGS